MFGRNLRRKNFTVAYVIRSDKQWVNGVRDTANLLTFSASNAPFIQCLRDRIKVVLRLVQFQGSLRIYAKSLCLKAIILLSVMPPSRWFINTMNMMSIRVCVSGIVSKYMGSLSSLCTFPLNGKPAVRLNLCFTITCFEFLQLSLFNVYFPVYFSQ